MGNDSSFAASKAFDQILSKCKGLKNRKVPFSSFVDLLTSAS
jgi:hypothetical protein